MLRVILFAIILATLSLPVLASDDPAEERHEIMEGVGDGAKAIGGMLKGELEFDADAAINALLVWQKAAAEVGALFPEGSYTGGEKKAKETVWTDREGFDQVLAAFAKDVDAAIESDPQSLDELNTAAGPIFKDCKKCHEGYRIPGD